MDYGNPNQNGQPISYQFEQTLPQKNGMVKAASALGIATIVATVLCTVYIPYITGSLAIIFALLSKGSHPKMHGSALVGLKAAFIGLVMNTTLIVSVVIAYFTVPEIREQADKMIQDRYGMTIDELWDSMNNQSF